MPNGEPSGISSPGHHLTSVFLRVVLPVRSVVMERVRDVSRSSTRVPPFTPNWLSACLVDSRSRAGHHDRTGQRDPEIGKHSCTFGQGRPGGHHVVDEKNGQFVGSRPRPADSRARLSDQLDPARHVVLTLTCREPDRIPHSPGHLQQLGNRYSLRCQLGRCVPRTPQHRTAPSGSRCARPGWSAHQNEGTQLRWIDLACSTQLVHRTGQRPPERHGHGPSAPFLQCDHPVAPRAGVRAQRPAGHPRIHPRTHPDRRHRQRLFTTATPLLPRHPTPGTFEGQDEVEKRSHDREVCR